MDPDDLFTLRNLLIIGNYEAALAEAAVLDLPQGKLQLEKEFLVQRAKVAAGNAEETIQEVTEMQSQGSVLIELQAAILLAKFTLKKEPEDSLIEQLQAIVNNKESTGNSIVRLVAGIIYSNLGDLNAALRAIAFGDSLEIRALRIQILLRLDRQDLAKKELESMRNMDEDATLTQLASAWVYLSSGGEHFEEAAFIFREQMEKWQSSDMLVNGLATSLMHMGRFEDAETVLFESVADRPPSTTTLANLIIITTKLQRGTAKVNKLIEQLRSKDANHPLLVGIGRMEDSFDRAAASFTG